MIDTKHLKTSDLVAVMDDCRTEYARRVRSALQKGALPKPELVRNNQGDVSVFKTIKLYRETHPHLDTLTTSEAVKQFIDNGMGN